MSACESAHDPHPARRCLREVPDQSHYTHHHAWAACGVPDQAAHGQAPDQVGALAWTLVGALIPRECWTLILNPQPSWICELWSCLTRWRMYVWCKHAPVAFSMYRMCWHFLLFAHVFFTYACTNTHPSRQVILPNLQTGASCLVGCTHTWGGGILMRAVRNAPVTQGVHDRELMMKSGIRLFNICHVGRGIRLCSTSVMLAEDQTQFNICHVGRGIRLCSTSVM